MPASTRRTPLTLIVAATQSNGIGLGGGLPWRLPQEMKYFARGAPFCETRRRVHRGQGTIRLTSHPFELSDVRGLWRDG